MKFPKLTSLKTPEQLRARFAELDIDLKVADSPAPGSDSPLGSSIETCLGTVGNRFSILPMEGWDATTDGHPTDLTRRRWELFGISGAKLIWGGEAVAVSPEGRANPNQLMINPDTISSLESLRKTLTDVHQEKFGNTDGLKVGLQLTHSGRFARPNKKDTIEPTIVYPHPILDDRYSISDPAGSTITDEGLDQLVQKFIVAAKLAQSVGYDFVDIKQCHGYFGHELLSGYDRPGKYGGSFENRTRFIRDIVEGIKSEAPGLKIGSRISIFDFSPYTKGEGQIGVKQSSDKYDHAFGGDGTGSGINLDEPKQLMELMESLGVELICATAGSPYYNPHIQRPATAPPSDGYQPPEDPLVGVARQIKATAELKAAFPKLFFVGSGYSYLQDFLPHVGQEVVAAGKADFVGLGRMVLSYPDMPADVIAGEKLQRKKICRTFSDCTTAPRNGMVSGCYPLDPFYKARPERKQLVELKKTLS